MEQSFEETGAASSPPKKKRGRPKKADKMVVPQTTVAKDILKSRRKKRKGFSKSVSVSGKKKKQQQQQQGKPSSTKTSQSDGADAGAGAPAGEKEESPLHLKVGQSVCGVVDGSFDAGYLVTVRVGNSEAVFRGVVFGPGLSLPLNRDNDVAPRMKTMIRDEATDVEASAASLVHKGAPVVATSAATPSHTPVSASIPGSSSPPSANEAHRIAALAGSAGMGYQAPVLAAPPPPPPPAAAAGSYTPPVYRSPSFGQSPMQNSPGGLYYAPTHARSPHTNQVQGGYYPPRGFPYPFHSSRAEYGVSPQFSGPLPSASPSPSLRGTLPPRAS